MDTFRDYYVGVVGNYVFGQSVAIVKLAELGPLLESRLIKQTYCSMKVHNVKINVVTM